MSDNVTSVQQQLSAVASNNTVNTWPQITPKPSSCVKCVLNSLKAGEECNCEWKEGCKRCERCEGLHAGCRVMPPAVRPEVARLFQLREQVEAFQQDSNTSRQELNRQRQVRQALETQKTTVQGLIKALRADSGDNDYTLLNRKRHAFDDVGEWVPKKSKDTTQATTDNKAADSGSSKMKTRSATRSGGGSGITTPAATQPVLAGPSGSTSQAASTVPGPQASVAPFAPVPVLPAPVGVQPGPIAGAQPNVGNVNNTSTLGLKDSNNNNVASVQFASGDVANNQSTTPHIAPHIAPAPAPSSGNGGNGKGKGKGKRKQDATASSQQGDNTTAPPAPKRARTRRGKTAQSIRNNNPSSSANNVGNLPLPAPAPIEPPAQQDPWHVYDDYLRQQVDPDVPPISPTSFMTEPESVRAVYAAGRGYLPLLSEYPPVARAREEESQSNYPLEPLMDAEELADYRRRQEEEDRRAGR